MKKLRGGSSNDQDTYFAILLLVGFGNVAWFATQGAWDAMGFFFCAYAVGHYVWKKPHWAVAAAIVAANLFFLTLGVREGLVSMKNAPSKVGAKAPDVKAPDAKGAPPKAPVAHQKDAFTDMFGSDSNLEKLMQRQTQLMSQLKNMAPLMQSAKEALKQLPSGYLEKALKTLKTNMAKGKDSGVAM
jgi:hypothetical protein